MAAHETVADAIKALKTLIIDNYDSYTFNLLRLCENKENVVVIRNDQFDWHEFKTRILPHFDNVVISPGPGRPEKSTDFGICAPLLQAQSDPDQKECHRPIFGVCLGHQGIAHYLGGKVDYAPRIMHGRMSQVNTISHPTTHYKDILHGCPSPFWAVRYHSLIVEEQSLPECLLVTAYCYEDNTDVEALKTSAYLEDSPETNSLDTQQQDHFLSHPSTKTCQNGKRTIMGFQHKVLPLWGVQFHPESVSTEYGALMMKNFAQQTLCWLQQNGKEPPQPTTLLSSTILNISVAHPKMSRTNSMKNNPPLLELYSVKTEYPSWVNPEQLVEELIATPHPHPLSIKSISWLDSSRKSSPYAKMSILSIDPALTFTYSTLHRQVNIQDRAGKTSQCILEKEETFFDYLSDILGSSDAISTHPLNHTSPLGFKGGLIGYFGYEMKRESLDGYKTPEEQMCPCPHYAADGCTCSNEPDAAFQYIDRFWLFDHTHHHVYACCLARTPSFPTAQNTTRDFTVGMKTEAAHQWLKHAEQAILQTTESIRQRKLINDYASLTPASSAPHTIHQHCSFRLFSANVQHNAYLKSIQNCIHEIKEGESYEICLTTRFRCQLPKELQLTVQDPHLWKLYTRHLRKKNPAPFSALLTFAMKDLVVMSSSPERFLSIKKGIAEMKPIKGTIGRVLQCVCAEDTCDRSVLCEERKERKDGEQKQKLWQDVKERAENLMIVDLIRNDLAQVCDPSSVQVPKLMHIETYEKVHHLVSTVCGRLRPHISSIEALRKCFPPGSMTGAPKLRSIQLLDQFEQHKPRGIYSGCLGYFSLDGNSDFNVVIRTAVIKHQSDHVEVSVGGGGAITFLSDPEQEWVEALLKTKSVAPSVKEFIDEQ
ncbi:ADC synthase [Spinellus fusiger]|nr:ADC synthase [Spinellus fusiger]